MPKPVTLVEAKARWSSHTRHCLTDEARRALSPSGRVWALHHGVPIVASKCGHHVLYFMRSDTGHVYASDDPPVGMARYAGGAPCLTT